MPRAQAAHDPVALLLVHAAVERLGPVAAAVERLGELVDLAAGPAEHDGGGGRLDVEDAAERGGLVGAGDEVGALADLGRLAGGDGRAVDLDADRIVEVALGDGVDAGRHRGREQHGLPLDGQASRIASMSSAKPMSSISSASSSTTSSTASSGSVPRLMWSMARPGRGHDHVHAALEHLELADDGLAAVDGQHLGAELAAVLVDGLGHLHGELAGGHQHQGDGLGGGAGARRARGSAGRTPRSCRCRWRPGPSRSRPAMSGGMASAWIGVGSS